MKAPKNVLEKPSKDTNDETDKVSPCKWYMLLLTIEACGLLFFGYQLIYGVKEMDRSLQGLSSEQKNGCAVDWIFVWDFFLAVVVLFTPRFDFDNFHNMYQSGGRFFYIMRLILTSVSEIEFSLTLCSENVLT